MIFIKKILCKIGWHWLVEHKSTFWDRVACKQVYNAWCKVCGKKHMVDSKVPFLGFRCELNERVAIMEYDESARAIAVHLSEFCDRSLPYPDMVADAARKAAERIIDLEEKCR